MGDVQSYEDEIKRLKSWISDRLDWIDANIPGEMIDSTKFVPSPITYVDEYGSFYGEKTGIDLAPKPNDTQCKLYPNPAEKLLNIIAQDDLNLIRFYTIDGCLVKLTEANGHTAIKIDISNLTSGLYILSIIHSNARIESRRLQVR